MADREQDRRIAILDSLLTTPHRKIENVYPIHADICKEDPLFYQQLAAWYDLHGEVRDHKEAFAACLSVSPFDGHRDVGLALLREMPPYQVGRVTDWIQGSRRRVPVQPEKKPGRKAKKAEGEVAVKEKREVKVEDFGLVKSAPTAMRTEINRYLKEREADAEWFDSTVMIARKHLKRLYKRFHVKPSDRARQILFENSPPEGSSLAAMKELAGAKTPADQARVIVEKKIPYRVAVTVVSAMTPTVLMALVEVMSPQELINNLGALRKRGAFDNSDIKALIEKKLEKAKTCKRVSALKAKVAQDAAGLSEETQKQLEEIGDQQVKAKGTIKKATALFIDKSGSQNQTIELGKQVAAMISGIAESDFHVYAFDVMPYPVVAKGKGMSDWQKAFAGIKGGGGTACGAPLAYMTRDKLKVEQVVVITDGDENNPPYYVPTCEQYVRELGIAKPNVVIVHVKDNVGRYHDKFENSLKAAGIDLAVWKVADSTDYYSLPGLLPMLTAGGKLDLLMQVMSTPLPKRRAS